MTFVEIFQGNIQDILLLTISIISFVIATFVYKNRKRQTSSRYFAFASVAIGLWVASRALLQLVTTQTAINFLGYFLFIPTTFIVLFLLYFSIYVGRERRHIRKEIHLLILIPWGILLLITLIPGLVFESATIVPNGINELTYGPLFKILFVPIMAIFLISYFPILIRTYVKSSTDIKIKLRYVLFGMGISIIMALAANLVLPLFGQTNLVFLGPLTAAVLVITVGYSILRKELWDLKLLITEIVIYGIILFLLIDLFVSKTTLEVTLFKVTSLILMFFFSWFLIRGIFREFRARQHVQELAEQLTAANKRLREIDVEKSEFVSIATHQLRTPLTIIKGYSSMLLEGAFGKIENPKHEEIIGKILSASQRLVVMVEDFLNISRIEKGEMSYNFKPVDIKLLVNDVVGEFSASSDGEAATLDIKAEEDKNYTVIADELKLRQVFTNLLDNAVKYSKDNLAIDFILRGGEDSITIGIRDFGIGIPKEIIPGLFHKFSRTKETLKLHKEGRGLGLYVAKQIVLAHHGKIWVESEGHNKGSTFFVQLPRARFDGARQEVKDFVRTINTNTL